MVLSTCAALSGFVGALITGAMSADHTSCQSTLVTILANKNCSRTGAIYALGIALIIAAVLLGVAAIVTMSQQKK